MRLAVDGDRALLHRLQQRRLGLGRGAVDLVGQQQLAEDRPARQREAAGLEVEQVGADDVARHQVGRELDAAEVQAEGAGEALGEEGLGRARRALQQDVAAGEQARSASGRRSRPGRRRPCRSRPADASARAFTSSTFTRHLQSPAVEPPGGSDETGPIGARCRPLPTGRQGRRAHRAGAPSRSRNSVSASPVRSRARRRPWRRASRVRLGVGGAHARSLPASADQGGGVVGQGLLAERDGAPRFARPDRSGRRPASPARPAAATRHRVTARNGGSNSRLERRCAAARDRSG